MADDKKVSADDTLTTLVQYFEDSVDATMAARKDAERDRDYYDNKQLTDGEVQALNERGQPPVIINRIKPKVDYLLGLERQSRTDPKAYPRNPQDEHGANAATDAIRFVCDKERFPVKRSDVFENIIVEGIGVGIVEVKSSGGKQEICIRRVPWDRFFYDPHSVERDFSDAKYKGVVAWMDVDDAKAMYGDAVERLYEMCIAGDSSVTYDDRPRHRQWADQKRKRIKLCEIYFKRGGKWMYAVYGKSGYAIAPRPSDYLDDEGEPCCPIEAQSCHVDRENKRYGVVRQLIGPQDEVNKRRSKALHLITMRQTWGERGAVTDIQRMKKEKNKPDGHIEVTPGMKFEFVDTMDMAQANLGLLQEAKNEIDAVGANAALTGKTEKEASGRALESRQQGGMIELGSVMDSLRAWQQAIYRQIWARIKQFWTAEVWVRVTDDEKNVRFAGLNIQAVDEIGQPVVHNNTAEMDVDINLEESPDTTTLLSEQFALLAEMYKANPQNAQNPGGLSFEWVIESSTLRNKEKILEQIRGGQQQSGPQQPPPEIVQHQQTMMQAEQAGAIADVQGKQAKAAQEAAKVGKIEAETAKTIVDAQNAATQPERDAQRFEMQQAARQQVRPPQ